MILYYKNKKIRISVRKVGVFGKISGLMFKTKETKNLLFKFKKQTRMAIHSWFVFFDFLAVWTDKNGKILEYKLIKPFNASVKPRREFQKLIEIPINEKNKKLLKNFK